MSDACSTRARSLKPLGVKESWVREHTRNGDIPHMRAARSLRALSRGRRSRADRHARDVGTPVWSSARKSPRAAVTAEGYIPKE